MSKKSEKKNRENKLKFFDAIGTIVGTTIGAGIFGLPYVFYKSGFLIGLINIVILFFAVMLINLYTAKITLLQKKPLELTGYAKILFGDTGKHIMAFLMFLSIIGALLAYIIGIGNSLASIFPISSFLASIISFFILASIVYFDLKGVKESETILTVLMIFVVIFLIFLCFAKFDIRNINFLNPNFQNFFSNFSFFNLFYPYGVILFSFLCLSAIPEARQEMKGNEKNLKKAILLGTVIPFVVYILFVFAIVGVSGNKTTEIATVGIYKLGKLVIIFSNLFVILAMATSFITLALALKWMLQYDYKINKLIAWFISCFIPLFMFVAGFQSFIRVLSITGGIAGGLQCIMVLIMFKKATKLKTKEKEKLKIKENEFKEFRNFKIPFNNLLFFVLLILFILGIIYQFIF